ncbi:MAG: hypothetical protein ACYSX0_22160 [Planctomycetota bacterium]|jgi:uncharacterized membrane protein YhaH (DUF805 family)
MMETAKPGPNAGQACPMASMCEGMIKRKSGWLGLLVFLPGLALVAAGVLILVEHKILFWLMAGVAIILGVLLLWMAIYVRRLGAKMRSAEPSAQQG